MKNNIYTIFSYNNFELKVKVYVEEANKTFVLMEELIDKVNINEITSDLQKDKVSLRIKDVLIKTKQFTDDSNDKLYLVFDPENYYYNQESYTFEFPEDHEVTKEDMQKIYSHVSNAEVAKNGYRVVNFNLKEMLKNGTEKINNAIGQKMNKITINGEIVFADAETYYNLTALVQSSGFKIEEVRIGGYLLKEEANLKAGQGIMEIGTEKISFVINQDDKIQQFSIKWGFRKIYETLFESLYQTYGAETSEKAVRFLMDYFPLNEYQFDVELYPDLTINTLIREFKDILNDYFVYIYDELKKQKIVVEEFKILIHEYNDEELIVLLDEMLVPKVARITYNDVNHHETISAIKERVAVKSFHKIKDIVS